MELDQEKFSTMKALAEMQTQLAAGRAEVQKLEQTKEAFIEMREEEVRGRVAKVLQESREALEQTTKNHDELSRYGNELKASATILKSFSSQIVALFQDFREWVKGETEVLDGKREEIKGLLTEQKILAAQITGDRKQLAREMQEIDEARRLLADRRGLLERGFAELKRKQEKL